MRMLRSQARPPTGATVAQVSFSETGGLGAVGDTERRDFPVFGPRGIGYRPCEGDNLLLLPADGLDTCVGVLCAQEGLQAGELRLSSSGGAMIHLKNNGDVVLNGVTITRDGQIIQP